MNEILNKVKLSLRIAEDDDNFDSELVDLIKSCLIDLGFAGVTNHIEISSIDEAVLTAIKTYCKIHFGDANGVEILDRLKASYNEQKAQMGMATGYTDWGNE